MTFQRFTPSKLTTDGLRSLDDLKGDRSLHIAFFELEEKSFVAFLMRNDIITAKPCKNVEEM